MQAFMVSQRIHFRYWTSQNALCFFCCFLSPLVLISHSVWSKTTRAGCSETQWTLGLSLECWQRDKASKFLHLKPAVRFHQAHSECSMDNTLSPKGTCLTQGCGHYWQSLMSVFLFAILSLSCLSQHVFLSIVLSLSISPRETHTLQILESEVEENWSYRRTKANFNAFRLLPVISPALSAFFPRHGSF